MLNPEALEHALQRIDAFMSVYRSAEHGDRVAAIGVVMQGLGMTNEIKERMIDWLSEIEITADAGPFMLGLLLGLFIDEHSQAY